MPRAPSRQLTRVVISTEDEEIAAVARELGADVPFLRPAALALDDTPMLDVLTDLVASLEQREQYRPDILVLLQPTSPFRRADHIDAAVDLLISSGADSVVTVIARSAPVHAVVPDAAPWRSAVPWTDGPAPPRRQDKPLLFARNGPAVVARDRASCSDGAYAVWPRYARPRHVARRFLDIDDAFDLEVAELLMAARPA